MTRQEAIRRAIYTMTTLIESNGTWNNPYTKETLIDFETCIEELERAQEKMSDMN